MIIEIKKEKAGVHYKRGVDMGKSRKYLGP